MNEFYPAARDQRQIDAGHLNLLAIFHFVGAGLALLGLFGILAHYAIFHTIMSDPKLWQHQNQAPPPEVLFTAMKFFYGIFATWFVVSGILNVLSGFFIRARKHRTFSLIVAGINCLHIPLGTTLGVFTFIVLLRQTVGDVYENR